MGGEYEAGGRGLSSYAAGLVHTNDIIDGKKDEAERGGAERGGRGIGSCDGDGDGDGDGGDGNGGQSSWWNA